MPSNILVTATVRSAIRSLHDARRTSNADAYDLASEALLDAGINPRNVRRSS